MVFSPGQALSGPVVVGRRPAGASRPWVCSYSGGSLVIICLWEWEMGISDPTHIRNLKWIIIGTNKGCCTQSRSAWENTACFREWRTGTKGFGKGCCEMGCKGRTLALCVKHESDTLKCLLLVRCCSANLTSRLRRAAFRSDCRLLNLEFGDTSSPVCFLRQPAGQ
jgi:hypothetical protein